MKVAILLGSPDISGGTYVIFEHAIRAKRDGWDVYIITEKPVVEGQLDWHPEAKELCWRTFDAADGVIFDIAVATWWRTVYELYRISATSYAYFVQSIESRFYPADEQALVMLVDATYMLPLQIITEATWIKSYLKERYGHDALLVKNGIRKDIYRPDGEDYGKSADNKLRVLIEGPLKVPFKNIENTIRICRQSKAEEIWLLTSSKVSHVPGVDRLFSRVPIHETPKIYRSCDVLVKLSYVEGMFGPPLEIFHCGGTSIVYNVTGHDEYIVSDYNAFVAQTDDEKMVVDYLNRLHDDTVLLERLKMGAAETARQWPDWEQSSQLFREALGIIASRKSVSQAELETKSKFFFKFYELAEVRQLGMFYRLGKALSRAVGIFRQILHSTW